MNKEQIYELLMNDHVAKYIEENLDYLFLGIPELVDTVGYPAKKGDYQFDVFHQILKELEISPSDFVIRMVILLQDIGKPYMEDYDLQKFHYKDYKEISCKMAHSILMRFEFPWDFVHEVCTLIFPKDEILSSDMILKQQKILQIHQQVVLENIDMSNYQPKLLKTLNL